MHPVFHVSLIKPYVDGGRMRPAPPPIDWDSSQPFWQIDSIIDHEQASVRYGRGRKKQVNYKYKIRWHGYGESHDTWEPRSNLLTCESQIRAYHAYRGLDPPPASWFT
jgi:hypothetical protein